MADASGSYVGQLDSTFPDGDTDAVNVLDDAVKKTRSVLVASFPSITGAVTKTHTEINNLASQTDIADFTDEDEVPRLIHKVSAAAASGAVIQEVTLTAGCDYEIVGSGLVGGSLGTNANIAVQVGDGTDYETGNDYGWIEVGYTTVGGSYARNDNAVSALRTVPFNNQFDGCSFRMHLAISAADANSTSSTTQIMSRTSLAGYWGGLAVGFCHNSAKTTLTRFRVMNDGAAACSAGTIFIWKHPQTVPA